METAPFFEDIADGPKGASAYWLTADDGVRIRVALWPKKKAKGTVLLFPGRTEYVEKYGRAAADLAKRGYGTFAIDWRGQGLADRLIDDRDVGYVGKFLDYQRDVAAMMAAAEELGLPKPFYLLAHSMGGAIGLRALLNGLPVQSAAFSAPMWGIGLAPSMRPAAWILSTLSRAVGLSHRNAPGTSGPTYVMAAPFEDNQLTNDPEMWDYMKAQSTAQPELTLGGPSLRWLNEALIECSAIQSAKAPSTPTLAFLGTDERIVDPNAVHKRIASWPSATLEMVEGAEHEVLMELPEARNRVFDQIAAFFASSAA